MDEIQTKLCKCGCGKPVKEGSEFLQGHFSRWKKNQPNEEKKEEPKPEQQKDTDKEKTHDATQEASPLIHSLQPLLIDDEFDDVVWFQYEDGQRRYKIPRFIGFLGYVPNVLLPDHYGQLLPVHMLPYFLGMYPKYYEFPEPEPIQEPQHEEPPVKPIIEPIKSELEGTKEQRAPAVPENAPEPKKKSLLAGIFGGKKKKEKANDVSNETKDMLREIANPGKAT